MSERERFESWAKSADIGLPGGFQWIAAWHAWQAATKAQPTAEPVAWMHQDGRVVTASTKASAERDGGAMRSSLSGYTIALYAAPQPTAEPAGKIVAATGSLNDVAMIQWTSDYRPKIGDLIYASPPQPTAEAVREAVTQFAGYMSVAVPELRALPHPTDLLHHVEAFLTKLGGRDE